MASLGQAPTATSTTMTRGRQQATAAAAAHRVFDLELVPYACREGLISLNLRRQLADLTAQLGMALEGRQDVAAQEAHTRGMGLSHGGEP